MKHRLIVCLILAATTPLVGQTSNIGAIAGRQVAVQGKGSAMNAAELKLGTQDIQIKSSDELKQLLRDGGIEPDAEALSLVYSMNPGMRKSSTEWQVVHIPVLNGFAPNKGDRVTLAIDRQAKDRIAESHMQIAGRIQLAPDAVRTKLNPASVALGDLSSAVKAHPASDSLLGQIQRESEVLDALSSKQRLTQKDQATVRMITADLQAKSEGLKEDAPDPTLIVRTVGAINNEEISLLTICYVPVALYDGKCDAEFKRPTSPTQQEIPIANYIIWAQDSTNGIPKTITKTVEVRHDDEVKLVVKQ